MSTPAFIITAVQDALKNSSYLTYINDDSIFLGIRESITLFPCIVIEPSGDKLLDETYPYEGRAISINIFGYIQVYDKEKQIVGDTNTKGVLDIENDIRKALSANNTLGLDGVYDVRLIATAQDITQYPTRGFVISVEVHYRQDRLTRS